MRNFTPKTITAFSFTVLTTVGAVLTITGFLLDWWPSLFGSNETIADHPAVSAGTNPRLQPAPETPTPIPTAAVASTARSMLKPALSIPSSSERSKGLRTVATTGVVEFDYETAIAAGRATPNASIKGGTLSYVALCAAQDGLFDEADEAVRHIPSSSVRSKITNQILEMRQRQVSLGISPSPQQPGWIHCR